MSVAAVPDPKDVAAVYARQARAFDEDRTKTLFEAPWLDRFAAGLPAGGRVLDGGCGTGEPISRHLLDRGFRVTGVDVAPPMIALAAARFPCATWLCADMRDLALPTPFDGVLAWGSLFHLPPPHQREALMRLAAHVAPGGVLIFTTGHIAGETLGYVGGEAVYHACLAEAAYRAILTEAGLAVVDFAANDHTCRGATVVLARRRAEDGLS